MTHFCTDCEGPISKNDNAFELAQNFLPKGDQFFSLISKYDDYLADIEKKPGYKAGNTLKLILPFFKAYGLTNQKIVEYSTKNILLVPKAGKTLCEAARKMPTYLISTSYEQYVVALCKTIDFPIEQTYSTRIDLDKYEIAENEKNQLKTILNQILKLPPIEFPEGVATPADISERSMETINKLNEIFFEKIPEMNVGKIFEEVNPVGGKEKAEAILDSLERTKQEITDVIYFGDSITDVEALRMVRKGGGIAVSFNGNIYAIREAEIAVISPDAWPIWRLVSAFHREGRKGVLNLARGDTTKIEPPWIGKIDRENMEVIAERSSSFRKSVRGEKIGGLG